MYQLPGIRHSNEILKSYWKTRYLWYLTSMLSWILLNLTYFYFSGLNNNTILLVSLILGIFFIGLIQDLSVNGILSIFTYWLIIVILGFLSGLIWLSAFSGSLILILVLVTIFTTNLIPTIGYTLGIITTITTIPITYALIFVLFIYGIWNKFIKPLHNSHRLSERNKLILEGTVAVAISIFISISFDAVVLVIFANNYIISCLLSSIPFALLTYSSFSEIYTQNAFFWCYPAEVAS